MERYKAPNKFIQYQLWQECRNGCKFCSERNQYKVDKKWALEFTIDKLNDPEVLDYDEVGFIGGEIFDNQLENEDVRILFYKMSDKICSMHFKKIYVATSLIFDIETYLVPYLNHLRELGVMDKVLLCTSYDVKYRFNCEGKEDLWKSNMIKLKELFPELKTHVETILTQHFINAVLNGDFKIDEFSKTYDTRIDYIEPSSGMFYNTKADCEQACPGFFPKKEDYIKFLIQEGVKKRNIDLRCMISYQIRASRIYHLDCGKFVCYEDRRKPGFHVECSDTSKKYELGLIDSEDSMEDIANELCSMLSED